MSGGLSVAKRRAWSQYDLLPVAVRLVANYRDVLFGGSVETAEGYRCGQVMVVPSISVTRCIS
jgi:hypothetical protein